MEGFDDCISSPCLLDELMDNSNSIVGRDVDLGFLADPVFATKESPSHESDSGCSDMYEDRSVSPSEVDLLSPVGMGDEQVQLFDFESLANDEDDLELASYLSVSNVPKDKERGDSVTVRPVRAIVESSSPEIDVESDSNDPDYAPVQRVVQAKAILPKKRVIEIPRANVIKAPSLMSKRGAGDIHVLPSSSRAGMPFDGNNNKSEVKPPAVKVVKVIKTTAATKQEIDNELLQALDDRNKKNAVQAKVNREKKKAYMKNLEDEIDELRCENQALRLAGEKDKDEKKALVEEVEYLKSVLANQSALAGLLKNIGSVENVKLSSSITRKRSADHDHDYDHTSAKRSRSALKSAGVCLHVDQGNVSLEFCSKCALMAKLSSDEDNS